MKNIDDILSSNEKIYENLRLVEIELFAFCNRICEWCPNSFIDRIDNDSKMDMYTYLKIIESLRDIEYKGAISYSRYNEPMSDIEYLKTCVAVTKLYLPDVKLVSNTNGDFITDSNLKGLLLDELTIMDYDGISIPNAVDILEQAGCSNIEVDETFVRAKYEEMDILYFVQWVGNSYVGDRGGSLANYHGQERVLPCYEPLHFVGIDYNGNVMPCCEVRSDNPDHSDYILGNVDNSGIPKGEKLEDILVGYKRKSMIHITSKCEWTPACKFCNKPPGRYTKDRAGIEYND